MPVGHSLWNARYVLIFAEDHIAVIRRGEGAADGERLGSECGA